MRQHVVLVSVDTLRADGITSNPLQLWPQDYDVSYRPKGNYLDYVAGSGAFFANTIVAAPYTSASHASIFTGQWPRTNGVTEFLGRGITSPTIFTEASRLGYQTAMKVDFPVMIGSHLGFTEGVDNYIVEDDDTYLDFIASADRSCSLLHFGGVHLPYGFHNLRFGGNAYRQTVRLLEDEVADLPLDFPADELSETYRKGEDIELLVRYKKSIMALYAADRFDRLFELYLEGIDFFANSRLERVLGRLLELLAGTDHLVVLFGDHGEEYDATNYGHFNSVSEGALRVPMIFSGTDIPSRTLTERVRSIDLYPTVRELARWPLTTAELDGLSVAESIDNGTVLRSRRAFAQAYVARAEQARVAQKDLLGGGNSTERVRHVLYREAVYDGRHKLSVTNHTPGSENREPQPLDEPITELFDVEPSRHPTPKDDVATAGRLLDLLTAYKAVGDSAVTDWSVSADLRRQLESNGYLQPAPQPTDVDTDPGATDPS